MRRRLIAVVMPAVLASLPASLLASSLPTTTAVHAAGPIEITTWNPYFQVNDGLASFNAHRETMAELNTFMFTATGAATIGFDPNSSQAQRDRLAAYKTAAADSGKPLIATISDAMVPGAMAAVIADPALRSVHVKALLDFATNNGFSGIDIDYERFAYDDGAASWPATFVAWGQFVSDLAGALHSHGLHLEVSVPPIYDSGHNASSGYWVYNYPALAQAADRVKVMAYNFSVNAGPIAPVSWVAKTIDAALQSVPADRLALGIPAYGTDWATRVVGTCPIDAVTHKTIVPGKRTVKTGAAAQRAADAGQIPTADPASGERTFKYVESFAGSDPAGGAVRCNVSRTVWYLDAASIHQRIALAQTKGLVGVSLWAGGYEDDATWTAIAAARAGQPFTAPDPIPPAVKAPAVLAPYPKPIPEVVPPPARLLDTRPGYTTIDGQPTMRGTRPADSTLKLQVAGRGPVPTDAGAVTLNVTVLGKETGYVTVYPCGPVQPATSNLNVLAGHIIANTVITRLSQSGEVCIYTQRAADLVVDVFNVLQDSTITALAAPARLLDTRIDGTTLAAGGTVTTVVAGRGGLGGAATTAVLNVTAVNAVAPGFLTVWPCDRERPTTSNVNYAGSDPTPNAVISALSATGTVCVFSSQATDVIIDVFGALDPGAFAALDLPARLVDTRSNDGIADPAHNVIGVRQTESVTEIQIGGRASLPAQPDAAVLNVTVTEPELAGFVTIYPCDVPRPNASNVNFEAGQTVPNLVISRLSASGTICVYTLSTTHVVVDVFGSLTL